MLMLDILKCFNIIMSVLFLFFYLYQVVYLILSLIVAPKKYMVAKRQRKFAFCIAARNEEAVISQLIDSIRGQNYPSELIDIYVVADNCTDNTAAVAIDRGVYVFSRQNNSYIGKGYALTFLFDKIKERTGFSFYDGYFIVDADNILDKNYVREMNRCAEAGNRLVMCYRNSKNYGDNWISAGYSLWFLRASRQLNLPRQALGVSCEATGTGFYICSEIIIENDGWRNHGLTEDIEFSVCSVLKGEKVAFCYDAIVYDEQPTSLRQSIRQRIRWCRGYFEILKKYGVRLLCGFFQGKGFSNYDLIMNLAAALFISTTVVIVNVVLGLAVLVATPALIIPLLRIEAICLISAYFLMFLLGVLTGICEWSRIKEKPYRVILYFFTFPIFIMSFVPISFVAMFTRARWEPVEHHSTDIDKFQ